MSIQNILSIAETYANHEGLKLSSLGAYVVNDGKFFVRLQNGGGCTLKTADRVLQWFSDAWPTDLEWPRHIPRPPKSKKEAA